jgi:phosphatidylserine decarboxylase
MTVSTPPLATPPSIPLIPVHPAGWPFIALFALVSLVLALFSPALGVVGLVLSAWCVWFFRDPERIPPADPSAVISPADGRIQMIVRAAPPAELGMGPSELTRVSIFLNVFNVHVNRVPASGRITGLHYRPGKFFNASLDKASVDNERQSVRMTTTDGHDIVFVQIAGLIARRILCDLTDGQQVVGGERFGIIRFGSRTDVYLPEGTVVAVQVGDHVAGGESVLAHLPSIAHASVTQ